jgi:hypothetical protein
LSIRVGFFEFERRAAFRGFKVCAERPNCCTDLFPFGITAAYRFPKEEVTGGINLITFDVGVYTRANEHYNLPFLCSHHLPFSRHYCSGLIA